MRSSSTVSVEELGEAIGQTLTLYHEDVNKSINAAGEKAAKELVSKTKATAPTGKRGRYKKSIAWKLAKTQRNGNTYAWYVKPPNHRLTHLIVHGHATRNGGRTRGNPFLANAWGEVKPQYIQDVEEAIRNGK